MYFYLRLATWELYVEETSFSSLSSHKFTGALHLELETSGISPIHIGMSTAVVIVQALFK